MGKPPKPHNFDNIHVSNGEDNILDLLADSKDRGS